MKNISNKYFLLGIALLIAGRSFGQKATTLPAFQVNFSGQSALSTPTADKPQSKLWYMDSCWWALLPDSLGPTLWQRTNMGWKEHPEIKSSLKGVPGRADTWYENREITAVGVSDTALCIFRIAPEGQSSTNWRAKILGRLKMPREAPKTETATIVKDATGVWWVAADIADAHGRAMYVWSSKDAVHWSSGIVIGENISADDICSIAALKQSVAVVWSDQKNDTFFCREHKNGQPAENWEPVEVIEAGNKTADDHINMAVSGDGALWVATKNSRDQVGYPQLVMRVRDPKGNWRNFPYQELMSGTDPSRPVVIATPHPNLVLAGHTLYDYKKKYADRIIFGIIDTTSSAILVKQAAVIIPDTSLKIKINNITGPKTTFPPNCPWIILASDSKGNIYEVDLRTFFN
ncbi:MAG: hypothetical protein QM594_13550 [Niabella sp.]